MTRERLLIGLFVVLAVCLGVHAQEFELEKHPGYVDLEKITIPEKTDCVTDITLGPAVLRFIKRMRIDDEDREKGISGIFSIRVKAFEVDYDESEKMQGIMNEFEKTMEKKGWENLVRVQKRDERMEIRVKFDDEKAVGIFVMAHESGEEAAFINVVGDDISLDNIHCGRHGLFGFDWDWF